MAPIIRSEVTASTVRLPSAWNSQDSKQTLLYVYDHGLKIAYHGMYVCMMCVGFLFLPLFLSTSFTIFCLLPVSLRFWGFGFFFFFLFCSQCVGVLSSVHVFSHSGFQCRIELPLLLVLFVWRRNKNIWVTRGGSNFRVSAYGKKLHNVTLAFAEICMVITVWWILKQVQNSEKELICNKKSTTIL